MSRKATCKERVQMMRYILRQESINHGAPCMCVVCEALIFDSLYAEGERDIRADLKRMKDK